MAESDGVRVGDVVPVRDALGESVALIVRVGVGPADLLAAEVREPEALAVDETDAVCEGEGDTETVPSLSDGDAETVDLTEGDKEALALADGDVAAVPETLKEAVAVRERVGDTETVTETVPLRVGTTERDGVLEGLGEAETLTEPDEDAVAVTDLDALGEALPDLEPVLVAVGETVVDGDAEAEMVRMSLGSVVVRADGEKEPEGLRVGRGEPLEEGVVELVVVTDWLTETLEVTEPVAKHVHFLGSGFADGVTLFASDKDVASAFGAAFL